MTHETDADEQECGYSYDHDLETTYDGPDGRGAVCRRCGAELWEDAGDDTRD